MEKQRNLESGLHFLKAVALLDVSILIAVILVCWLLGWRTAIQYGSATFFAGVAVIALGITSTVGGFEIRGNPVYKYGQSVGTESLAESTRQDMQETDRDYDFLYQLVAVGLVLLVLGALIQTFIH